MGLDGVEFIMAVEDAFAIEIPDADAEQLVTPGHVARYLAARLATASTRWSDADIESTIARLMTDVLGVEHFEWDQRFVEDLGIN
jgi:hypothetical protein